MVGDFTYMAKITKFAADEREPLVVASGGSCRPGVAWVGTVDKKRQMLDEHLPDFMEAGESPRQVATGRDAYSAEAGRVNGFAFTAFLMRPLRMHCTHTFMERAPPLVC